jgi:hypothetical protein
MGGKNSGRKKEPKILEPLNMIDYDKVGKLASFGLTIENIANVFGLTVDQVSRDVKFRDIYYRSLAEVGARVRVALLQKADKDTVAGIYLDKVINKTSERFHDDNLAVKKEELQIKKQMLGLEKDRNEMLKVQFITPKGEIMYDDTDS